MFTFQGERHNIALCFFLAWQRAFLTLSGWLWKRHEKVQAEVGEEFPSQEKKKKKIPSVGVKMLLKFKLHNNEDTEFKTNFKKKTPRAKNVKQGEFKRSISRL